MAADGICDKRITVNGQTIRYLDFQIRDRRSNNVVILLHGYGGTAERWSLVTPILSKFYRLIVPDLVGYGQSDKPNVEYTPKFFVSFLHEFVSNLNFQKVTIIGTSISALFTTEFAIRFGELTDKIVLCAPPHYNKDPSPALDSLIMSGLYPTLDNALKAFIDTNYDYATIDAASLTESTTKDFIRIMEQKGAKYAFMSTLLGLKYFKPSAISKISCPSLIIWGENDVMVPPTSAHRFKEIPDSNLVILKGCGHNPYIQKPVDFCKTILKFLIAPQIHRK